MTTESDVRAIRQVLEAFVDAWNTRNPDAFANLYTEPHVDVNHAPPVETRASTVGALRKRFESASERLSVTSDEVLVFGDWAVQRGAITLSGKDGTQHLHYVELLRREADGQWRVHWGIDAPFEAQ